MPRCKHTRTDVGRCINHRTHRTDSAIYTGHWYLRPADQKILVERRDGQLVTLWNGEPYPPKQ